LGILWEWHPDELIIAAQESPESARKLVDMYCSREYLSTDPKNVAESF